MVPLLPDELLLPEEEDDALLLDELLFDVLPELLPLEVEPVDDDEEAVVPPLEEPESLPELEPEEPLLLPVELETSPGAMGATHSPEPVLQVQPWSWLLQSPSVLQVAAQPLPSSAAARESEANRREVIGGAPSGARKLPTVRLGFKALPAPQAGRRCHCRSGSR